MEESPIVTYGDSNYELEWAADNTKSSRFANGNVTVVTVAWSDTPTDANGERIDKTTDVSCAASIPVPLFQYRRLSRASKVQNVVNESTSKRNNN